MWETRVFGKSMLLVASGLIVLSIGAPKASAVPPLPSNNVKAGDLCLSLFDVGDRDPRNPEFTSTSKYTSEGHQTHTLAKGAYHATIWIERKTASECTQADLPLNSFRSRPDGDEVAGRACIGTDEPGTFIDLSIRQSAGSAGIASVQYCSNKDAEQAFFEGRTVRYGPKLLAYVDR